MTLSEPTYGALRALGPGDSRFFNGGQRSATAVTAIQNRAGGEFAQRTLLLVDPDKQSCQRVLVVTCLKPCRPKYSKPTKETP